MPNELHITQLWVKRKVAPSANDTPVPPELALRMAKLATIHTGKTPIRLHYIVEWARHRHQRQADIVNGLGVDKATVSRWFAGSVPSERHLIALAGYLEAEEPVALFRHPDDDWIARLLSRGTEKQRARIMRALRALLEESEAA